MKKFFPDSPPCQLLAPMPISGILLSLTGENFSAQNPVKYHFSTTSVGRIPILAARLRRIPSRIRRRVAGGAGTDFSGFHP